MSPKHVNPAMMMYHETGLVVSHWMETWEVSRNTPSIRHTISLACPMPPSGYRGTSRIMNAAVSGHDSCGTPHLVLLLGLACTVTVNPKKLSNALAA